MNRFVRLIASGVIGGALASATLTFINRRIARIRQEMKDQRKRSAILVRSNISSGHGVSEDKLRLDYEQTSQQIRTLTDIRFKLLAFVPTLTGAAVALLSNIDNRATTLALGFLGLVVTLGIVFYELRNSVIYDAAIHRAKWLEVALGLPLLTKGKPLGGLFQERPKREERLFRKFLVWHDRGLSLVYSAALGGWVYIILYSLLILLNGLSSRTNGLISISLAGLATLLFMFEFHRFENTVDQPKPTEKMAETRKAAQKSFYKGVKVEGKGLTNQQAERFAATIHERINWYLGGRRLWSFAHYSTLFVAGISSALAAIIPQLQEFNGVYQKDLASILAGLAALLIALNTTGGFGRKWQTNRSSSSKVSKLQIELIARDPTSADIDRLRASVNRECVVV